MGCLLAITTVVLGVSSVAISGILASAGFVWPIGAYSMWANVHAISSYALCSLVVVHLAMHWAFLASAFRVRYDPTRRRAISTGVNAVAALGVVALGVAGVKANAPLVAEAAATRSGANEGLGIGTRNSSIGSATSSSGGSTDSNSSANTTDGTEATNDTVTGNTEPQGNSSAQQGSGNAGSQDSSSDQQGSGNAVIESDSTANPKQHGKTGKGNRRGHGQGRSGDSDGYSYNRKGTGSSGGSDANNGSNNPNGSSGNGSSSSNGSQDSSGTYDNSDAYGSSNASEGSTGNDVYYSTDDDSSLQQAICTLCRKQCPLSAPRCNKPYEAGLI